MMARVLILLRARLAAQRSGAGVPIAALWIEMFIAGVVCGLVRGEIPPFAYALVALSVSAALVAMPLLGDLAPLLVADESGDWIRAQPVKPSELHLARTLHLLIALAVLSLGTLVPAAVLADSRFGLVQRLELVALGLAQSLAIAAVLLSLQALLRERAQALLVALQTALFVGALIGMAIGLRVVQSMGAWHSLLDVANARFYPPAWFAAPLSEGALPLPWKLTPLAAALVAALALAVVPAPAAGLARRGQPLLGRLLKPARSLAARLWVRGRERAAFEWLFDALPKERDFVIRTYPLLAVPAAFLWIGARGESASSMRGWLALLLFVPGAYLPLLAAHVPASTSHRARWLIDTAPVPRAAIDEGAIKAIAVRFLLPFYALLALLGCSLGGAELTARLALPGFLAAVLVLRATWPRVVTAPPLSTAPDELYVTQDWMGMLGVIAAVLVTVAIVASRFVDTWWKALAFVAVLVAIEIAAERSARAQPAQPL